MWTCENCAAKRSFWDEVSLNSSQKARPLEAKPVRHKPLLGLSHLVVAKDVQMHLNGMYSCRAAREATVRLEDASLADSWPFRLANGAQLS